MATTKEEIELQKNIGTLVLTIAAGIHGSLVKKHFEKNNTPTKTRVIVQVINGVSWFGLGTLWGFIQQDRLNEHYRISSRFAIEDELYGLTRLDEAFARIRNKGIPAYEQEDRNFLDALNRK